MKYHVKIQKKCTNKLGMFSDDQDVENSALKIAMEL